MQTRGVRLVLVPPEWLLQEYPVHTVEMEKDDHHPFLDIDIYKETRWLSGWWGLPKAYPHKPISELQITPPSFQQTCHFYYHGAQDQDFEQQRNPPRWIGGPPLRKVGTAKDRYNAPSLHQWGYLSPLKSPLYLPLCHMSRWHTAILAEGQPKMTSCVLACRPGRSPSFSYLVKDDLGLKTTGVCSILYDCGQVYIGQTGQSIEPKVKEQYWHIWLSSPTYRQWLNTFNHNHHIHQGHQNLHYQIWLFRLAPSWKQLSWSSFPTVWTGMMAWF